jgi:hypothetical protein
VSGELKMKLELELELGGVHVVASGLKRAWLRFSALAYVLLRSSLSSRLGHSRSWCKPNCSQDSGITPAAASLQSYPSLLIANGWTH